MDQLQTCLPFRKITLTVDRQVFSPRPFFYYFLRSRRSKSGWARNLTDRSISTIRLNESVQSNLPFDTLVFDNRT